MRGVRSASLTRETDVLDTWFSSALWPFATLGWPEDTDDLRTFYPGDLNTTARDIIRLWENRMIFTGLELMGDIPFSNVVIHSLVHAPSGGRMSKSLGTGMNPLALIDEHGADATRYGLMKMASSQDVTFSEGAIEEGRKLANKLWNASRLLILAGVTEIDERPASLEERWILARLSAVQRRSRDTSTGSTSRTSSTSCTTSRSTTSATGTWRRSSRACTAATPTRSRRRWRRSSGCSSCSIPSCRM